MSIVEDLHKIFPASHVDVRGYWYAGKLYLIRDTWPANQRPQPQYFANGVWTDCPEGANFNTIEPWIERSTETPYTSLIDGTRHD